MQRSQILPIVWSGVPFTITYVKCDRTRKKGGDIAILKDVTGNIKDSAPQTSQATNTNKPAHQIHKTFNVKTQRGDLRKIHLYLVLEINGEEIRPKA
jgi:hypothetical protein